MKNQLSLPTQVDFYWPMAIGPMLKSQTDIPTFYISNANTVVTPSAMKKKKLIKRGGLWWESVPR